MQNEVNDRHRMIVFFAYADAMKENKNNDQKHANKLFSLLTSYLYCQYIQYVTRAYFSQL